MDSNGHRQLTTMFTEFGVYKILFKSRKPIAKKFQKWVCQIIKDIRLIGEYNLQSQLEENKKKKLNINKSRRLIVIIS